MSAPVINPTTSVLGFSANTYVAYQPSTMDGQTGTWACPNLPAGLSINTSTGLISGTPTQAGIYNCVLSITNSNGTATLAITIGIDGKSGLSGDPGIETYIDLVSGAVTFPTSPDGKLHGKEGDYLELLISLQKNGVSLDLPVVQFSIGIKEWESNGIVILADGAAFTKVGAYNTTCYRTLVYLEPAKLAAPLSDYASDNLMGDAGAAPAGTDPSQLVTQFAAPMEIRIELTQTDTNLTPSTIERSSQIFPIIIERNLSPAP